ncbi:hypothetical protein ABN763_14535 [Spongiivirga sp. MCCC 1A20706]|uniref:hypothetical protein n=1 Tax=Spongiivirga sp. MCCC 1A20706 TaxID=3160963 RepID=UPI0039773FBE
MNIITCRFILVILLIGCSSSIVAQEKLEKEYRIRLNQVPQPALDYVSTYNFQKVKWYAEESLKGISIEAKARTNKKYFSIEFDKNGILEDVEITINKAVIVGDANKNINQYLDENFRRYRIRKIQQQFSGNPKDIRDLIKNKTINPVTIKYELIVKGKDSSGVYLYELLFNDKGKLEQRSKIIFRNSDNLEY